MIFFALSMQHKIQAPFKHTVHAKNALKKNYKISFTSYA